jgi:outer membrane protein OmpA-like peptidoglycan-associated protein
LCGLALGLAGCAGPVGTYHNIEGGAIAQARQAPPGANLPYPNLASVPTAPRPATEAELDAMNARLAPVPAPEPNMVANPAALAGLTLPGAVPPPPNVPGVFIPATPTPHVLAYKIPPAAPAAAKQPNSAPISLAFRPGSAILDNKTNDALTTLAGTVGDATVLAGGFGQPGAVADAAALKLALERARAIADALTAAGVPASQVTLVAGANGEGGFAQLVY